MFGFIKIHVFLGELVMGFATPTVTKRKWIGY